MGKQEVVSGIYQIKNTSNGKIYIGSSNNIYSRWKQHINLLNKQKHHSKHLQNAWNKYGEDYFVFEILEIINTSNRKVLLAKEQMYIDKFLSYKSDKGYNTSPFTNSGALDENRKLSKEIKIKISNSLKGKQPTKETKNKMSDAKSGSKNHQYNVVVSDETRRKLSISQKQRFEYEKENHIDRITKKKFTEEDVRFIRKMKINGYRISELAEFFNVSIGAIKGVIYYRTYKWVKDI